MHLGLQLQDQHSSSTESINLSHRESTAMGKTSSQDQSASSDSIHDEGRQGQVMRPGFYMCNPELSINASQSEVSQPMMQFPFAYSDPYLGGLYTGYGPHTMIQPPVMGAVAGRVPLPADLPEDGPIFVNAKQYQGILRRRQTRAKLEAQNRLVKARKPYLHESRHQHALNRVRGTGGRFLSTKKSQNSDSQLPTVSQSSQGSFHYDQQGNMVNSNGHRVENNQHNGPPSTAEGASIPSHMATSMQGSGDRLVYNGNQHYAPIVQ